jgi:hypothetical protein
LALQRADRCIERRQLSLQTITPEGEGLQLAFLMAATALGRIVAVSAAKERREHGKLCCS